MNSCVVILCDRVTILDSALADTVPVSLGIGTMSANVHFLSGQKKLWMVP
jgi:hypothetical protein